MKSQLELTFQGQPKSSKETARQRRTRRARWWFDQMRHVVDRALDRQPAPPARPEQIYLVLGNAESNS